MVLKRKPGGDEQGEAIVLDTLVNSIDAEVVAKGTSDKGTNRGAVLRHGPYTLWAYSGGPDEMTSAGENFFVNTVHYAARQGDQVVLERRMNMTRDGMLVYIEDKAKFEEKRKLLPKELADASKSQIRKWLKENRPYLRTRDGNLEVDEFAQELGIPNHQRAFLEKCIELVAQPATAAQAYAALKRYTEQEIEVDAAAWQEWYAANADYLFFSDCDGFRFLVDEEAKEKGIPTVELRGWSSEELDYKIE